MRRTNQHRGAIAEYLAIARLLELDHKVATPVVDDDGVDLVVDYRHKVQVKSAQSAVLTSANSNAWAFQGSNLAEADFFLCWAKGADVWWVVPGPSLRLVLPQGTTGFSLLVDPVLKTRYAGLSRWTREAWHLLREEHASDAWMAA